MSIFSVHDLPEEIVTDHICHLTADISKSLEKGIILRYLLVVLLIYSNKKETSDFHGTVSFDPAKMLQQK